PAHPFQALHPRPRSTAPAGAHQHHSVKRAGAAMKVPFRYRRLGYVALNVSDIEKSTRFYVDQVGLDLSEAVPGGPAFLRCSHNHHDIVLYPSGGPGLRRVAFELETQADFARAREYLQGLGLAVTDVSPEECKTLKQGESLRF